MAKKKKIDLNELSKKEIITVDEAAAIGEVCRATIHNWIKYGWLKPLRAKLAKKVIQTSRGGRPGFRLRASQVLRVKNALRAAK